MQTVLRTLPRFCIVFTGQNRNADLRRYGCYAAAAPTLQCAPSESTNCASTPPKSCFFGGILKSTPLALMSR